jgi:carbon-monoxide dehydrogenase small subunit
MNSPERVPVTCTVNGRTHNLEVAPAETLLQTLRRRLFLTGTQEGCIEGECGACTVLIEDQPIASCIYAAAAVDGRSVRTVEGLGNSEGLNTLQKAFVDHAAVQCGFCTPGLLMTLTALLEHNPSPAPDEIRTALAGNICRCTGYQQIIEAVVAASETQDGSQ